MKVIAESDPEACVKYSVMEQIDRFGWRMDNTEGVQSTISLPWAARQVNMAFSEAAPKFKVLPQNQFTMVQAITPIPTSSGLLNSNCSAMAVFISTPSQPSSIAIAASLAVPTPASTMIGTFAFSTMVRML